MCTSDGGSRVVEGRCTACQIVLQFFQDSKPGEDLMFARTAGGLVHYNPPVSFEKPS